MILDKIYCGLDIGNHSLKASLVRVKAPNRYELLEALEAPTRGFKKSYVSDLGEFSESIHRVLKELTRKSAGKFKGVHLGLGGHTVEMRYSKALIPLVDKASKVITTGDLKKVNKQSRLLGIKMDEEILHDFPQQYLIILIFILSIFLLVVVHHQYRLEKHLAEGHGKVSEEDLLRLGELVKQMEKER